MALGRWLQARSRRAGAIAFILTALTGATAVAIPPQPPEPPQRILAASAFSAIDADEFDRAHRIVAGLQDPLARKLLRWFILVEQRTDGDFQAYVDFIAANPDWPWQYTLQHRAEGAMPSELPDSDVRAFFADRKPVSPYGAERYADALISDGLTDAARALLRHTWVARNFPYADEKRFYARYGHLLTPELHRQRLDRLIWERQLGAAQRQARRVDQGHRALAHARIRLARMQPGVDGAIAGVPEDLRDHPGLVFERARWRQRKGRFEGVLELLDPPRPDAQYPEVWWPIRHWTARTALDRGDISVAYRIAANHGMDEGLGFAQGEWLAGWIALQFLREPETAYPHFKRLYEGVTTPVSRARGAYWSGRAAEAAGRSEDARRWYETAATNLTTFYGQLAAARLGENAFLALPRPPSPDDEQTAHFEARELVRAVRLLSDYGLPERTDRLVMHLADETDSSKAAKLVADLAHDIARHDLAVRVARQARREGIILPDHRYPVVPLPHVVEAGHGEGAVLLAIVRQESGFDVAAVSRAGARGLMQLMPATARNIARELDLGYSRGRLTADAGYNLRLGSRYISKLLERYDGSLLLAVAAYNAGPSRVSHWLRKYGDPRTGFVDPVDWIESLPFAETRNYVQRVFESLMVYRHRLAPTEVALALESDLMLRGGIMKRIGSTGPCCL
jgi:soluble lytic murein transglycosylase